MIQDDPLATLDPKAVIYSTVTCYLGEAKLGTTDVTLHREPSSPHPDDSDRAILAALAEKPLLSV
jgi:glycerol-3-phosphate dehydrogenase